MNTAHFPDPPGPTLSDVLNAVVALAKKLDRLAPPAISITVKEREYLTIKQASEIFSLSPQTLYRMRDLHVRRGRAIRIRRSAIEQRMKLEGHKAA